MTTKIPIVAIVGRTNVGKSTLFNAIAGRRMAIVQDTPGVTRDRNFALIKRHGFPFTLIDTGGLVGEDDQGFQSQVRSQTESAIAEADLVLGVFDGVGGVNPLDSEVVDILRRAQKPVLWLINKCESPRTAEQAQEFYQLGIDSFLPISAAHHIGVKEIVDEIRKYSDTIEDADLTKDGKPIRVAVIGRPNVGKSTFVNKVIGEDRLVTSPVAGTTTDSIDITVKRDGISYTIIDTAGLRKKARIDPDTVERYSNLRTLKSLASCHVAILILDATDGIPGEQDSKLAGLVHERGRGLVVVVNKWDAIEKDHRSVKEYERAIKGTFKFAPYAPIVFVSAITGRRCPSVLDAVKEVYQTTLARIQTSDVNRILKRAFTSKPPPTYHGEPIKLFFATQVSVAPPTFVLVVNHPKKIGFSYERYLKNELRKEFPFEGVDIKIIFKKRGETDEKEGKSKAA